MTLYSCGMVILRSIDAVNWKIEGHAIQNLTQMNSNLSWQRMNRYGFSVWAGAIRYHHGMFWIYLGTAQDGYHDKGKRPCWPMVPAGVDIEASQIGRLLAFWDDNGKEYFVGTNFSNGYQTWLFEMTPDGQGLINDTRVLINSGSGREANKLYKINGWFYHMYSKSSGNGRYLMMQRAKSINGPYLEKHQLSNPQRQWNEPNQGGFVQTPNGKWVFLTHHGSGDWSGRVASLLPVNWIDGWPIIGQPGSDGIGNMVWTNTKPDPADAQGFRPQGTDDFQGSVLGPQWEWNYQPRDSHWSLSERPNYLRLHAFKPLQKDNFRTVGNILTQRVFRTRNNTVTLVLDLAGLADGQVAGLTHFTQSYATIGVHRDQGHVYLEARNSTSIIKGQELQSNKIWLRTTWGLDGISKFSYKTSASSNFIQFPVDKGYQMQWRDYRGDRLGIFTFNNDAEAGYIDCESFTTVAGEWLPGTDRQPSASYESFQRYQPKSSSDALPTSTPPTQRPTPSRGNTSVEGFGDEVIAEPAEPPGSWVPQDYGESESAMGFARKIYRLGSQIIDEQQCSAIPGGACGTRTPLMRPSEQRLPISSIIGGRFPKQNDIDSLLEDYFEFVHWFSLVIYEPRFRKRIESIKDGYAYPTEAPLLTLLSIMLCMAAWYRSKKTDQEGAEEWRLWSDELLRIVESRLVHIMDQHSIAAVQTLILLGSHHVYHGRPNLSFALLGATIKISHAMGLHGILAHGSVDDVEERKRVWWTIYTWDRFASISYGRPLSINDEDCNVGMPAEFIESPFFKAESIEQWSLGVRYSPYQTQLTTLYLVASPALKTIFGSLSAQSAGQHFGGEYRSLVNDVTQKLLAWRRDLPSFLSLDLNRDYHPTTTEWDTRAHQLQSLSLQLTFDNVMIVLHRPFLARQIENLSTQTPGSVTDSPLAQAMAQHVPPHSSNSPSQNGQSPRFEENASSEYWWSAAVGTARIIELPYLAELATDSHLVAFMAMNLFHAAIVLTLVALSDPLSDPAQAVKRTITRVFRLQERLGQRSALASQSSAVLENLIFLLLRREGEAMLGPAPTKSGPINSHMEYPLLHQTNHEQTLRLPLEAALNTDQRTGISAGSNLSIVQRLNESLASVQQIIPPFFDESIQPISMSVPRNEASQQGPVPQPQQDIWLPPGGLQEPTESLEHHGNGVDYGANGLFWLWDSAWTG
ncbi:C6 transcription factor [Fusarium globosum]|uniref:C6 transcription factor n=1 Tax=Fusarium globosum TaxID=78864 RepID=A0A8H5XNB0_9HYPO|nr:C6 transcription factor [Fusarium globosum]